MIRKALVFSLLVFAAVVAPAFANAPNPIPSSTRAVAVQNADGSTTVTVMGTWQWGANVPSGGQKDCNDSRSGIGYAIAWNDPNSPGNVIPASGAQPAVAVGDSHDNWVHSVSQPGGPFVSSTSPNVSGNGNEVPGDGTDATHLTVFGPLTTTSPFYTPVTESMAGTTGDGPFAGQGIPTTALGSSGPLSGDQNSWFSNCGPVSSASVVFHGQTITTTGNDSPASPKNGFPAGF